MSMIIMRGVASEGILSPRPMLCAASSALALFTALAGYSTAQAQTSGPAASTPGPATTEVDGNNAIQEVIVTALRREETVQRVPLQISVVSGASLVEAGVSQPEDLNKLVPGLKLTNGATTSIYVRGVGENSAQQNSQSAIAFNIDGVYLGRTSAFGGNFYDLERVEVLKGPQGTLYGRNASGGAINLITTKPQKEFGGYVQGELGDYNLRRLTGALNVPVTGQVAVRAAFYDSKHDGYNSDGFSDEDIRAGRLSVRWTPSDTLRMLVTADESQINGLGQGAVVRGQGWTGFNETPGAKASRAALGIVSFGVPGQHTVNHSLMSEIDWDTALGTLTVQGGYRNQKFNIYGETAAAATGSNGNSHQYTLEARLARQTERFKYVIGAYYFNETVHYFYHIEPYQGFVLDTYQYIRSFDTKSAAAFGEGTYSLTDKFRATVGLRYTHEDRDFDMYSRWYGAGFAFPHVNAIDRFESRVLPNAAVDPLSGKPTSLYTYYDVGSPTFKNVSGKVGAEYDLAPRALLYGTITTGFKSGGFSLEPAPYNVFQPEKLTAYTLGLKSRLLENTLQFNVEAFDWEYKNQQIAHLGYDINGAAGFVTDNAGSSRIYGVNFDTQWRATRSDTFGLNIEFLHAKFLEYNTTVPVLGPFVAVLPTGCRQTPAGVIAGSGAPIATQNCSGLDLPFTPHASATASYSHIFDLGDKGGLVFGATAQAATRQLLGIDARPQYGAPSYITGDTDLTYRTVENRWSLTAYIRNVNNARIRTAINTSFTPITQNIRPPRTYGVILRAQF